MTSGTSSTINSAEDTAILVSLDTTASVEVVGLITRHTFGDFSFQSGNATSDASQDAGSALQSADSATVSSRGNAASSEGSSDLASGQTSNASTATIESRASSADTTAGSSEHAGMIRVLGVESSEKTIFGGSPLFIFLSEVLVVDVVALLLAISLAQMRANAVVELAVSLATIRTTQGTVDLPVESDVIAADVEQSLEGLAFLSAMADLSVPRANSVADERTGPFSNNGDFSLGISKIALSL